MTDVIWPLDYKTIVKERMKRFSEISKGGHEGIAKKYYRHNPVDFINHWCMTYDPRNVGTSVPADIPFILFPKQIELVNFLKDLIEDKESGLIEKSRDMGATWVCAAFSTWLWLFTDASVGWGSRKEQLVDRIGDPDSIFEKIRRLILCLPAFLLPKGFNSDNDLNFMKCINPETGATITGEGGDNIGRGGRKLIYFKDESAHYEHSELIEAALGDNTNVQVDISSVNGPGNVFYRKRHSGTTRVLIMDWRDHPAKDQAWYDKRKAKAESEGLEHIFAQEVDRDYTSSVEGILIPAKYVNAAIDAHIKLGFEAFGEKRLGLDVADEGNDKNALIGAQGPVLLHIEDWSVGDTSQTAIKAFNYAVDNQYDLLRYDSIGVGAGVKAKTSELKRVQKSEAAAHLKVSGFNAGAKVVQPERKYTEGKKNKDMFANLKAQATWLLRDRFYKTYRAVELHEDIPHEELISLPSKLKRVNDLKLEISRPKRETDAAGRVKVESKKDMRRRGMPSPNLLDGLVMVYAPDTETKVRFDVI